MQLRAVPFVLEVLYAKNMSRRNLFVELTEGFDALAAARLVRLENGNFGECAPVGEGVWELKTDWGPGYRVYYAVHSKRVILLCEGGDKRKQNADIKRAIKRWNEWQKRGKK